MQLNVDNITFSAHGRTILSDVCFHLPPKRWRALLGPNGSGKTTLLRVLAGILKPSLGFLTLSERELKAYSKKELARVIGYVPQRFGDLPQFTVNEFLALSSASEDNQRTKADHTLLEEIDGKTFLPNLSGGELQRVMIAGALCQNPEVLLLDEPTNNLDPLAVDEILRVLLRIKELSKVSALLVTHDINFAVRCADEIALMKSGKVEWIGSFRDGEFSAQLERVFGIRFHPLQGRDGVPFYVAERIGECLGSELI